LPWQLLMMKRLAAWIEQIEAGEDATEVWEELIRITPEAESVVTNLENHITETSRTAKEAAKDAQDYLEEWENTLEELREEFSEHNISMLALAAALDPEFFETAKTAGEGWLVRRFQGRDKWMGRFD
jgi:predicted  nucleic acid-binding Zn-ribbon protein